MSGTRHILLVDDDPGLLRLLSMRLESAGYCVTSEESGEQALTSLSVSRPDLIVTDLRMDGMDGMALFDEVRRRLPTVPVIILTAHGSIQEAVTATRNGAFGFITKPFDSHELMEQIESALALSGQSDNGGGEEDDWRSGLITCSPRMEEVLGRARRVAASEASVFIRGDSGTGKELLARAVHRASRRRDGAFVAINCGAIPEQLLESELFGHRKGAFTGATQDYEGLFKAADGGTLFLDEIGDMPLTLQVKLLRVLQERQVRPVGATRSVPVDVRVISATHRDISRLLDNGEFREDLYYRLNVVSLELPSLAERSEDIPLLARHFLREISERYGQEVEGFSPEALERLSTASWPGNVRQLLNVVEQAVTLSSTSLIPAGLIEEALQDQAPAIPPLAEARAQFERDYLARILRITGGNVTRAARLASRNRTEFYKLLNRHGLDPARFKDAAER